MARGNNGTPFELQDSTDDPIDEQTYYDQGILMVAWWRRRRTAYETMVSAGISKSLRITSRSMKHR